MCNNYECFIILRKLIEDIDFCDAEEFYVEILSNPKFYEMYKSWASCAKFVECIIRKNVLNVLLEKHPKVINTFISDIEKDIPKFSGSVND